MLSYLEKVNLVELEEVGVLIAGPLNLPKLRVFTIGLCIFSVLAVVSIVNDCVLLHLS